MCNDVISHHLMSHDLLSPQDVMRPQSTQSLQAELQKMKVSPHTHMQKYTTLESLLNKRVPPGLLEDFALALLRDSLLSMSPPLPSPPLPSPPPPSPPLPLPSPPLPSPPLPSPPTPNRKQWRHISSRTRSSPMRF